jgi:predicted PurR-regulated permease PerM
MKRALKTFGIVLYVVAFCVTLYLMARALGPIFWKAVYVVVLIPAVGWLLNRGKPKQ